MNKKLLALAVSAAVLAPAALAAENEVVLYGQINVAVQAGKVDAFSAKGADQGDQTAVGNLGSRIGFKGQETLGDGMSAFFQIENGVAPDNADSSKLRNNGWAAREAWVGLKGDFGSVKLGRGKSIYTTTTEELDAWYQDQSFGLTANEAGDVYRVDNSIRYEYAAGPLSFAVSNAFGENKTSAHSARNDFAVSAKYATEDFAVFGAYDILRQPGVAANYKRAVLGGTATLGDLMLGAAWQHRDNGSEKGDDPLLLVSYTVGNLNLQAGAILWDKNVHGDDKAKTQVNLASYYSLSKRSVALVEYSQNWAGVKNFNVLSVGLSHSF